MYSCDLTASGKNTPSPSLVSWNPATPASSHRCGCGCCWTRVRRCSRSRPRCFLLAPLHLCFLHTLPHAIPHETDFNDDCTSGAFSSPARPFVSRLWILQHAGFHLRPGAAGSEPFRPPNSHRPASARTDRGSPQHPGRRIAAAHWRTASSMPGGTLVAVLSPAVREVLDGGAAELMAPCFS